LAKGKITATNVRGKSASFGATQVLDDIPQTYWATDDGVTAAALELDFGREVEFNRFLVQEQIVLGQRIKKFSLQSWNGHAYETIAQQTTIGHKRILRFPTVKTSRLKLNIEEAKACPAISKLAVYNAQQ
jgi:alpha-L-fucosidase